MKPFAPLLALAIATAGPLAWAGPSPTEHAPMDSVSHLQEFDVIELRRYTVAPGARTRFTAYFDAYFPEAFEQLGAMVFGQFLERDNPDHFTWLRGYRDLNARPVVNANFYYGPLWKEHRTRVNAILPDSDNVLLLRPLDRDHRIPVLPAVDPIADADAPRGLVVAQLFAVAKGSEDAFAHAADMAFARYRIDGVHAGGVLVTLDVPNNFPQLPVRDDGPWLVWLGIVRDEAVLHGQLDPAMAAVEREFSGNGMLRGPTERIVMTPSPRSRLRWQAAEGNRP